MLTEVQLHLLKMLSHHERGAVIHNPEQINALHELSVKRLVHTVYEVGGGFWAQISRAGRAAIGEGDAH